MFRRTNVQVEFGFRYDRRIKIYRFLDDGANGFKTVSINQHSLEEGRHTHKGAADGFPATVICKVGVLDHRIRLEDRQRIGEEGGPGTLFLIIR
jgi:hypothetical protein